jgi:hypothetical protein
MRKIIKEKSRERSEMRGERRSMTMERDQRTRKKKNTKGKRRNNNDVRHQGRIKALEGRRWRRRALTEEVAGRSWPWYRPMTPVEAEHTFQPGRTKS